MVFHRLLRVSPNGVTPEQTALAVLLCKRTQDAPIHPGHWGLFGGTRKESESAEEAANREVREELKVCQGLDLVATGRRLTELTEVPVSRPTGTVVIRYFSCAFDYDLDKLTLLPNDEGKVEGEGLGWFTEEEVCRLLVRPEDLIAVRSFFKTTRA